MPYRFIQLEGCGRHLMDSSLARASSGCILRGRVAGARGPSWPMKGRSDLLVSVVPGRASLPASLTRTQGCSNHRRCSRGRFAFSRFLHQCSYTASMDAL